jgi:hypothetical protein
MSYLKFILVLLLLAPLALSAQSQAHHHFGKLNPHSAHPPQFELSSEELKKLQQGDYVIKQFQAGGHGGGYIVQDINAPLERVWSNILNFGKYTDWVNHVEKCEIYAQSDNHLKVEFIIGAIGITYQYYIDHIVDHENHYMRWTLDYQRLSEIDDVVGFWYVQPHPQDPTQTRLFYSVEIMLAGWVPGFIQNLFSRNGLVDAASWVRKVSEPEAVQKPTSGHSPAMPFLMMPESD